MAAPISPAPFSTTGVYNQSAIGIVVDYDDPEEKGRVRIRLMNQNDIPKEKLPWVIPKGTMGGQVGGAGYTSHQLLLGQPVSVEIDPSTNQPTYVSYGIAHPSGEQQGGQQGGDKDKGPGWPTQARTQKTSQDPMKAPAHRKGEKDGHVVEDEKDEHKFDEHSQGRPKFKLDEKQLREQALKIANGLGKFIEHPSGGPQIQLPDIIKHIKQFDPQNLSGAIKPALDMMQNLLKKGGAGKGNPFQTMEKMLGSQQFQQLMQIVKSLRSGGGGGNQPQPPPVIKPGDPCLLVDETTGNQVNGHYFIIAGEMICVEDR